jgi:hypothetical protein
MLRMCIFTQLTYVFEHIQYNVYSLQSKAILLEYCVSSL